MTQASEAVETNREADAEIVDRPKPIPGKFTQTSLTLKPDLTREEWVEVGNSLRAMERGIQFWVGDWLAYGEAHYGEDAFAELEKRDKTLANWASVARGIPASRRREDVPFSHHAEVAPLRDKPEAQDRILERVAKEDLSVGETRELVQQERQKTAEAEAAERGQRTQTEMVYRYCGCCGAPESAWSRTPASLETAGGSTDA